MSINQYPLQRKSSSSFDSHIPTQDDHGCQKKDPSLGVPPNLTKQVDQHLNTYVDGFRTFLQTYQMEFDAENPIGRLPGSFTREFGETISEYVILRDPNQNEFEVHVVRRSNELYFDDGWFSLKDAYDVCFGAWVSLTYVSPKLLGMRLFTRWGVEVSYPCYNPPLRHLLARSGPHCNIGSSVLNTISAGPSQSKSLVRTYVKQLTFYDIHSGTLLLPWYGFGQSAFAFIFSDLTLVDNVGKQYKCTLNFGVDINGELSCNVSGGWLELCAAHGVVEGDIVKLSVAHYFASNVMYVCIYPRVRV